MIISTQQTHISSKVAVLAKHVSEHLSIFVVAEKTDAERPANGGLRLLHYSSDEICIDDGKRLAGLMTYKHDLYGTGFAGGKIVARAQKLESIKEELISITACLLNSLKGAMFTGCDLNTNLVDMEKLTKSTPYVLAAVGSPVNASAATAQGTLGAIEAVLGADLHSVSPGRALVHGCGAVGNALARNLLALGWSVFTLDINSERAKIPGAIALPVDYSWWDIDVDLLLPCSISGLIDEKIALALRVKAIVPAANAPFEQPELADYLRWRGIRVLPDPLVNAGAVIADSIERFAPAAWRDAGSDEVYAFVRAKIYQRASLFLNHCYQGLSVNDALTRVAAQPGRRPIGLSFGKGI